MSPRKDKVTTTIRRLKDKPKAKGNACGKNIPCYTINELERMQLSEVKRRLNITTCDDKPSIDSHKIKKWERSRLKEPKKKVADELIAPIKFVIRGSFTKMTRRHEIMAWQSACLQFSYYVMGACVMPVIFYTFGTNHAWTMNLHIYLSTVAYLFLVPWGLLVTNPFDSAAFFIHSQDRKDEASILKIAGSVSAIIAFIIMVFTHIMYFLNPAKYTLHSIFVPEDKTNDDEDDFEFVGNVHVTLVNAKEESENVKAFCSILVKLAYFFTGATSTFMLFYCLSFKMLPMSNIHILSCTIGFQILIPTAFIMENRFSGTLKLTSLRDRRTEICLVKLAGIVIGTIGSCLIFVTEFHQFTDHAVVGILAALFSIVNMFCLPCSFVDNKSYFGRCVQFIGTPSFILSSISFILACFKPEVVKFAQNSSVPYFMCLFVLSIIFILAYDPVRKLINVVYEP